MLYFLQPEKFMNGGRNLKYSGEGLAVAISQLLGAFSDSRYIADITGFGFKISYTNLHRYRSILQAGFKAVMLPFQCMMPCLTL
jgi:hypothetical protein